MTGTEAELTFPESMDGWLAKSAPNGGHAKTIPQARMTLSIYAKRLLSLPAAEITAKDVLGVLAPLWFRRPAIGCASCELSGGCPFGWDRER
jgi:hypothetical protein